MRPRPADELVAIAQEALKRTGHSEIALTALSSSDYPGFRELLERMNAFAEPLGVGLSLSSLRINDQLALLPEALSRVRKSGLTVAPEAGTERLRARHQQGRHRRGAAGRREGRLRRGLAARSSSTS